MLFALSNTFLCFSQIGIGTGTTTNQSLPVEPYYGYSYTQSIYLASEIGTTGDITTLSWHYKGGTNLANTDDWVVFIGHTTKTSFSSTSDWVQVASMTQVWSGTITLSGTGDQWITIDIADFTYNGTDNLIIAVDENSAGYNSSTDEFYCSSVTGNRSLSYYNDATNPNPSTPPTATVSKTYISNVILGGIAISCPAPSTLTATNITSSSIDLNWTDNAGASQWDIELGLNGFTPTGTATQSSVSKPHTYSGLSSNTAYQYYVRADCGGGDYSSWVGPYSFTTSCATYTVPYFEGFESGYTNGAAIAGCLSQQSVVGTATWVANSTNTTYNRTPRTGSFNTTLYYSNTDWIFIPIYLSSGTNYTVSLFARQDGATSTNANITVKYGTTASAAGMTNTIVAATGIINGTYQEITGDFSPASSGTFYIGILGYISGVPYYISMDDISIIEGPTCIDPSTLTATNITATTADLSWTENGTATSWEIEIGAQGFSPTGTPTHIGVWKPYPMSGLNPETSYSYYLRADCGSGDYSNWVGPYDFTTTVSCPQPNSLGASNITTNSADLNWTENGCATVWQIEMGLDGFIPTGIPTQSGISNNPYTYSSLVPGTAYDYYLRSYCGIGDESSWVGPYSFTTQILAGDVNITASAGITSATYTTLKETFDKINDGTHQGIIEIEIGSNDGETITETSAASLNKSGVGSASYSSIIIRPGAANIKLVGSIAGACCIPTGIIKLNGAENVIIDGRIGSTGSTIDLTIENTNTGTWGCAFAFVAASHNVLRYCILKSGNTNAAGIGTVSFSDNNVGGGVGSSFNLMEECHVTNSGSNIPRHAIAGDGAYNRENYNNIIRNCSIYNFEEFGIFLGSSSSTEGYNRGWLIEGNDIYQTISLTNTFKPQIGICIGFPYSSSSSGKEENGTFTILNNNIGGNGSGGYWNYTGGLYPVAGIYVYSTTSVDSSYTKIDGNQIMLFNISNSNGNLGSSDKSIFTGIISNNCRTWIGNSCGNTIGSMTDEDNLKFSSTAGTGNVYGINMKTSTDNSNRIINNSISGIQITEGTGGMTFHGIHNNCSTTNTSDSISQNNISYISLTKCNYFVGISANGYICKNRVRDIDFTGYSSFSGLTGIEWYGGDVLGRGVENNEIILGNNKAGISVAVADKIVGINLNRNVLMYYNSVLIEGTGAGSDEVIGVYIDWATGTEFKNNLVYIDRQGGSGTEYALYNEMGPLAVWTSSNNAYVVNSGAKSASYLGYWDKTSSNISDLATWESTTGESNSIFDTPTNQPKNTLFPLLATQDNLDVDDPSWLESGIPSIENIDIRNNLRDPVTPTIGAYEKVDIVLPIELISFNVKCESDVVLVWETQSEVNSDIFEVEKSIDAVSWFVIDEITAAGNSNSSILYQVIDTKNNNGFSYYRLKQIDIDGKFNYSNIIFTQCKEESLFDFSLFPNPTSDYTKIQFTKNPGIISITVFNSTGQIVLSEYGKDNINSNEIIISTEAFVNGLYYVKVIDEKTNQTSTKKLIINK